MENQEHNNPNYIPKDLQIPFDLIELPSQGILYPNKKSSVKVEYLTALDENILSSPNIINSGKVIDILLERKVKDLGFDPIDLLEGDRTALVVYLRTTAFGEKYNQLVLDRIGELVEGEIDLSQIKPKKLSIHPDTNGEFDYKLPNSGKMVKFKLLTGRDIKVIDEMDKEHMKRYQTDISNKIIFKLERCIGEIDGERDKIKLSNIIKRLTIIDSRKLRSYIDSIEPGLDFDVKATTPGGESVDTFLRFNSSFFWPEL
jgi:hypothetical protein